ncbi:MAG: HAD family phosphatase [Lentisphaerae bacterium]|jgi:beta-phosphoglucomutase family hydrolase|nr:HAD family phosphatase [Lentisphaerota bacterium]
MTALTSRAFLFDLDGVVVDSNQLHVDSWAAVAERHGHPLLQPDYIGKCGLRTTAVIRELLRWPVSEAEARQIGLEKETIYRDWIRAGGIDAIPGVVDFIRRARELGVPCAVASSAPRANLDLCVEALGLASCFQATVSGEDVTRGKPAPDIFLAAAAALGVEPNQCVVFEDAPAGVQAARAASMAVIALTTSHLPAELAQADQIVPDFTKLDPSRLL